MQDTSKMNILDIYNFDSKSFNADNLTQAIIKSRFFEWKHFAFILTLLHSKWIKATIESNQNCSINVKLDDLQMFSERIELYKRTNISDTERVVCAEFCEFINHLDETNLVKVYNQLIEQLYDKLSTSGMTKYAADIMPRELSSLFAHIIRSYGCQKVYNPFAGLGSIAIELKDSSISYIGQEIIENNVFCANMRFAASRLNYTMEHGDSIDGWLNNDADAIVAMMPWGSMGTTYKNSTTSPHNYRSFEDAFYEKAITNSANVKLVLGLSTTGFCVNSVYLPIRKELCKRRIVDTIIELPEKILGGIGVKSAIIILTPNKIQNRVKFVNAQKIFIAKAKNQRILDIDQIIQLLNSDNSKDICIATYDQIEEQNYIFDSLYYTQFITEVHDGQQCVRLKSLAEFDKGQTIVGSEAPDAKVVTTIEFSNDFYDIINPHVSVGKQTPFENVKYRLLHGPHIVLNTNGSEDLCIYFHKSNDSFMIKSGFPLRVTSNLVTPEYLVYALLNNKHLRNFVVQQYGRSIAQDTEYLLNCRIIIDETEKQKYIVDTAIETERNIRLAVLAADKERFNLLQASSDLIHMLGTPLNKQSAIINRIKQNSEDLTNYQETVDALIDVSLYIQRIINSMEADYQKVACVKVNKSLTKLVLNYCKAWKNFGVSNFELSSDIDKEELFAQINETNIMVMLDTILDNARRHGFNKSYSKQNQVKISLSSTTYQERPYALLSVANNGFPMNSDFGIKGFISRGRFDGNSGRSGLGGYHIYSIVKKHDGYMNIRSDENWNFIMDILLPLNQDYQYNNYSLYGYDTV